MTFAEGLDENATIINLENAKWNSLLQTPQSFVDGYWGRILIRNMTNFLCGTQSQLEQREENLCQVEKGNC